jgi:hypothetical protein
MWGTKWGITRALFCLAQYLPFVDATIHHYESVSRLYNFFPVLVVFEGGEGAMTFKQVEQPVDPSVVSRLYILCAVLASSVCDCDAGRVLMCFLAVSTTNAVVMKAIQVSSSS